MRRITYATLLAAVLGLTPVAGFGQSSTEGVLAFNRGDDQVALEHLRPLAEQGNAVAQYYLGVMFATGRGVAQSDQEAVAWFRRAAEQDNLAALNSMGFMYLSGRGVPQNDRKARAWFRRATEKYNNDLGGW